MFTDNDRKTCKIDKSLSEFRGGGGGGGGGGVLKRGHLSRKEQSWYETSSFFGVTMMVVSSFCE